MEVSVDKKLVALDPASAEALESKPSWLVEDDGQNILAIDTNKASVQLSDTHLDAVVKRQ